MTTQPTDAYMGQFLRDIISSDILYLNPRDVRAPGGMTETHGGASMFDILSQKRCTKCGEIKLATFFYWQDNKPMSWCKDCTKAHRKSNYRANPEKFRELSRSWNQKNPEKNQARALQWYKDFPDKVKERVKKWKKENPEKVKVGRQKYDQLHPDSVLEKMHRRRAKRINVVGGHFTEKEWSDLLDAYGHRCLCCGRNDVALERDHVIPLGPPHSDEITNIQPLCRSCNASKGAKVIDYR